MFQCSSFDKDSVKAILGNQKYEVCYNFFKEFLLSEYPFKIIMTRRCFSLFKIFYPLLEEDDIHNYPKTQIITDKAVPLYAKELMDLLTSGKASVLIIDDVIIFGRTINSILDSIIPNSGDIKIKELTFSQIQVRSIIQNAENSLIREEYRPFVSAVRISYNYDWRIWSDRISKLISSCLIANTSYVVSATTSNQLDLNWTADIIGNRSVNIQWCSLIKDTLANFINGAFVRIYHYITNSNVVIPLVILRDMTTDDLNTLCDCIINKLPNMMGSAIADLLQTTDMNKQQVRLQLATLLLSHAVLKNFFAKNDLSYSVGATDCNEILMYNFSTSVLEGFKHIESSLSNLLNIEFEPIAAEVDQKSLDIPVLAGSIRDVSSCREGKQNERSDWFCISDKCKREYIYSITRLIDSGRASIKTSQLKNGNLCSLMYSGEQAYRIGVDLFAENIDYFRYVEYLWGKKNFEKLESNYKLQLHIGVLDILKSMQVIDSTTSDVYQDVLKSLDSSKLNLEYVVYDDPVISKPSHMLESVKAKIRSLAEKEVQSFVSHT